MVEDIRLKLISYHIIFISLFISSTYVGDILFNDNFIIITNLIIYKGY